MSKNGGDGPNGAALFEAAERCAALSSRPSTSTSCSACCFSSTSRTRSAAPRRARARTGDPASDCYIRESEQVAEMLEDRDEYVSENVFSVPEDARWRRSSRLRRCRTLRGDRSRARSDRARQLQRCATCSRECTRARRCRRSSSARWLRRSERSDSVPTRGGARPARSYLRVLHQGVRPRRGHRGGAALHPGARREAAGRDARAAQGPRV